MRSADIERAGDYVCRRARTRRAGVSTVARFRALLADQYFRAGATVNGTACRSSAPTSRSPRRSPGRRIDGRSFTLPARRGVAEAWLDQPRDGPGSPKTPATARRCVENDWRLRSGRPDHPSLIRSTDRTDQADELALARGAGAEEHMLQGPARRVAEIAPRRGPARIVEARAGEERVSAACAGGTVLLALKRRSGGGGRSGSTARHRCRAARNEGAARKPGERRRFRTGGKPRNRARRKGAVKCRGRCR